MAWSPCCGFLILAVSLIIGNAFFLSQFLQQPEHGLTVTSFMQILSNLEQRLDSTTTVEQIPSTSTPEELRTEPYENLPQETTSESNSNTAAAPPPLQQLQQEEQQPTVDPNDVHYLLSRIYPPLTHGEFHHCQRAVLDNVSLEIKLQAYVAARYMDELVLWNDKDEERVSCRASALNFYLSASVDDDHVLDPIVPYRQGALLYFEGDYVNATKYLGTAIALAHISGNRLVGARAYFFLGLCFEMESVFWRPRALAAYRSAIELDGQLGEAHHKYGLQLLIANEYRLACKHIELAMFIDPYRDDSTALLMINDYQGHNYVEFTGEVVAHAAIARSAFRKYLRERPLATLNTLELQDEEEEREAEEKPYHLIFCINTGRSGSHFLATVFRTMSKHYGYHEPMPQTQWHDLILKHPFTASYQERVGKVDAIKATLKEAPRGSTYSETSLNFVTQFHDVVIGELLGPHAIDKQTGTPLYKISVIVLRRDLTATLRSIIDVGWFMGEMLAAGEQWDRWTHEPHHANSVLGDCFHNTSGAYSPDQYDRAIWYLLDIEARAQFFMNKYGHLVHLVQVDLEHLKERDYFINKLVDPLELSPSAYTWRAMRAPTNDKSTSKQATKTLREREYQANLKQMIENTEKGIGGGMSLWEIEGRLTNSMEYCDHRIVKFLERCGTAGVQLPQIPHWKRRTHQ